MVIGVEGVNLYLDFPNGDERSILHLTLACQPVSTWFDLFIGPSRMSRILCTLCIFSRVSVHLFSLFWFLSCSYLYAAPHCWRLHHYSPLIVLCYALDSRA